ncbi:MAG: 4'-phosphopantetheinyl transferase superfamily protein [Oscillospiraceae bacterium]|jgi:4'-phosphopantetheinyl transferase|nr:4'-phosphopantetheinyl transferase superfamily protein [Oscillospiraceae bacterium]
MLYVFDDIDCLGDSFFTRVDSLLSNQRREKAQKYKSVKEQNASIAVFLLLRLALKEQYGINEAVEFGYNSKENVSKPYLIDYPEIHFNLSHCKTAVACAVLDIEVGVDVQHITTISETVAKRVLTDNEYKGFKKSKKPNEYFTKIWTIKESYVKKTGQGIVADFSKIIADDLLDKTIYKSKNYICCITQKNADIKLIKYEEIFDGLLYN